MSKLGGTADQTNNDEGEFIQVRKKSERSNNDKNSAGLNDKKKSKPRSRNNSIGEGKPNKARYDLLHGLSIKVLKLLFFKIEEFLC